MLYSPLKITIIFLATLQSTTYAMESKLPKNVPARGDIDEIAIYEKLDSILQAFTHLETRRLIIRRFRETDFNDLFEIKSDPEVNKYDSVIRVPNEQDVQEVLKAILSNYEKNIPTFYAIEYKENGKVVGLCGFNQWVVRFYRTSLGYCINREYWNRGICTEAAQAVVEFAFNTGWLTRIDALCDQRNFASRSVLKKLGMRFEGLSPQYLWNNNGPQDIEMHALLYCEWQKNKNRNKQKCCILS